MHVPISFVKDKNKITRALYHIAKTETNIKKEWKFLNNIKSLGHNYKTNTIPNYRNQ